MPPPLPLSLNILDERRLGKALHVFVYLHVQKPVPLTPRLTPFGKKTPRRFLTTSTFSCSHEALFPSTQGVDLTLAKCQLEIWEKAVAMQASWTKKEEDAGLLQPARLNEGNQTVRHAEFQNAARRSAVQRSVGHGELRAKV